MWGYAYLRACVCGGLRAALLCSYVVGMLTCMCVSVCEGRKGALLCCYDILHLIFGARVSQRTSSSLVG